MGYVDDDGYLYLTDRSTFMIVAGGVNIYPQEAENLLVMHPNSSTRRCSGCRTTSSAKRSRLSYNRSTVSQRGPALEAELIEYCRANLATYKCPRTVEFDPTLPRDPNGKLYKRRIRERYWQGRDVTHRVISGVRPNRRLGAKVRVDRAISSILGDYWSSAKSMTPRMISPFSRSR